MPEPGQLLILIVVLVAAGGVVAGPLVWRRPDVGTAPHDGDDVGSLALRHRIAVESLRDVEADRRAGSLDEEAYAAARVEAEERAARTRAALEAAQRGGQGTPSGAPVPSTGARRAIFAAGGTLGVLVLLGTVLPAPLTLANGSVVNTQLAAQEEAEAARQRAIGDLEATLAAHPQAAGLVQLADLYLQGGTAREVQHAASLLILAVRLDPKQVDAYRLLVTAYIQAGDYKDATAATDAYATLAPTSADIPFFRGLVAYRGAGDRSAAIRWFDAFLKAAPNDPRAVMVRSLRAEAAGELPGAGGPTTSPGVSPGS